MPRESVYGSNGNADLQVSVGWEKEGPDVSVGVVYSGAQSENLIELVSAKVSEKLGLLPELIQDEITRAVRAAIRSVLWTTSDSLGLFTQLDQNGVNRLIRSLKNAGKGAFGPNEW